VNEDSVPEDHGRVRELLGLGAAAAPSLDPTRVLAAARRRRARRRGVLAAGAASAAAVAVVLAVTAGGFGRDDAAPIAPPPSRSELPSPSASAAPTPPPTTEPSYVGPRFVLVNGSTCDGVEGSDPATEVLCFDVADRAVGPDDGPLRCSTGPRAVGPTPPPTPDRALADGTPVQVLADEFDQLQGYVRDRFFVLYGLRDVAEKDYLAAALVCTQAPPLEQVLRERVVYPGPAVAADEDALELVRRLVAYADAPSGSSAASVPFADHVQVGQVGRVEDVGTSSVRDGTWPPVGAPGGALEPVQALELLAGIDVTGDPTTWRDAAGSPIEVHEGAVPECASDLGRVPASLGGPLLTVLTPGDGVSGCLDWQAIGVYATEEGRVYAVTVDRYEP
jgi:hypothetical protein